jgi:hypothetical protein
VPWFPELFSAPALARLEEEHDRRLRTVPYYAGLLTGETDALIRSFSGEPVVHDPHRGRIRGVREFTAYAAEMKAWLEEESVVVDEVDRIVSESRGVEENVLHFRIESGAVDIPVAMVADKDDGWLQEIRIYHSTYPLTGRHDNRPPMLQADPDLHEPAFVASYQRALAEGDADAIVALFEPDGYAREPAGDRYVHSGPEGIREFYEWLFSNGGGIPLEHCTATDDGRACALEYNAVRWGEADLLPQAGVAVYVRGQGDTLAATRIYDDVDPPLADPV